MAQVELTMACERPHAEASPRALTSMQSLRSASKKVLVVDDDAQVRALIATILRQQGYVVMEAENGLAAYELIEQLSGHIHLLITDIDMPQMSGYTLGSRLKDKYPHIPVLYISGIASLAEEHLTLLRKPVARDTLLERVRTLLTA